MTAEATISPYFHPQEKTPGFGTTSTAERPRGLVFFAFDQEVIGRPSPAYGYLIPNLEVELEAPNLVLHSGTASPRPIGLEVGEAGIVVQFAGTEQAVRASLDRIAGNWSLANRLGALLEPSEPSSQAGSTLVGPEPVAPPIETRTYDDAIEVLQSDASVAQMATQIRTLTQLSDGQLANLFPGQVQRETYQRWRTGHLQNPTPANRRRMGVLTRLMERLGISGIRVRDWIQNPTDVDGLSPYQLLVQGRLDEIERLAARDAPPPLPVETVSSEGREVAQEAALPAFVPHEEEPVDDLVFQDNDEWDEIESDVDENDS